jgi:hypothetical protein
MCQAGSATPAAATYRRIPGWTPNSRREIARAGNIDEMVDYAGTAYATLIQEQVDQERNRKASLEQRGAFVTTSSGGLVTLLFGLVAIVAEVPVTLSSSSVGLLITAMILFVLAVVLGICVDWPIPYGEPHGDWMKPLLTDHYWGAPSAVGSLASSKARYEIIGHFREQNAKKANVLIAAFICEVLAIAGIALVVAILLIGQL